MARLAEQLGRRFEARAFRTIALASNRTTPAIRNDLRGSSRAARSPPALRSTLEERLASQLNDDIEKPASAPRPETASDGAGPRE